MLYIYTVTSPEQLYLCDNLKKSLSRFDQPLTTLPLYETNNFSKLKINAVLQQTTYNDDDFIVICDGFDVVCALDPLPNIKTYFDANKDVDILFSSENMFGNNMVSIKEYYDYYNSMQGTEGKYLNAGVVIGRANQVKEFYNDLTNQIETLKQYLPPERRNSTGDQTFIINYLYHIDFINYTKIKIKIDLKDELTFTNTIVERPYNVYDYIFIHTWGIYISDPHYKYIKDQQYDKWQKINRILNLL
jgi:hypothetical protein